MRIFLSKKLWTELNVDDEFEFVRCAFYIGYSNLFIRTRVKSTSHAEERRSIIETAHLLGIKDTDVVVLQRSRDC